MFNFIITVAYYVRHKLKSTSIGRGRIEGDHVSPSEFGLPSTVLR